MTTITIDIPDPQWARLTAKAKAQGITLQDWFRQVAEREAALPPAAAAPEDYKEWKQRFDEWIASHDHINVPVLSDEDMTRESIYPDRS